MNEYVLILLFYIKSLVHRLHKNNTFLEKLLVRNVIGSHTCSSATVPL